MDGRTVRRTRSRPRVLFPLAAAIALAIAAGATPAVGADPIWVLVAGPQDWAPSPGFRLDIGTTSWSINSNNGGGVTSVPANEPVIVRLVNLDGCAEVARFLAAPGTSWVIEVHADESVDVESASGRGLDTGPALDPVGPAGLCVPDTSTEPAAGSRGPWDSTEPLLTWAGLAAAIGTFVWLLVRRPSRDRHMDC